MKENDKEGKDAAVQKWGLTLSVIDSRRLS